MNPPTNTRYSRQQSGRDRHFAPTPLTRRRTRSVTRATGHRGEPPTVTISSPSRPPSAEGAHRKSRITQLDTSSDSEEVLPASFWKPRPPVAERERASYGGQRGPAPSPYYSIDDRVQDGSKVVPKAPQNSRPISPVRKSNSSPLQRTIKLNDPEFRTRFLETLGMTGGTKSVSCVLKVQNLIAKFAATELDSGSSILDLVVLTGTSKHVWATTCRNYINETWPQISDHLEDLIQMLSQPWTKPISRDLQKRSQRTSFSTTISVNIDLASEEQVLNLSSEKWQLLQTVEALCWLFATIQGGNATPVESAMQLEVVSFQAIPTFRIAIQSLTSLELSNSSSNCWLQLVPHSAIAVDFKTPDRNPVIEGMEVSFELMCFLCGLEYEIVEDGGVVLYGDKSLVYPVRKTGNCIQWHFQSRYDDDVEIHKPLGERLLVDDLECLCDNKRHFLGLWSNPVITLGTDLHDITALTWSKAQEQQKSWNQDGQSIGGTISLPKVLSLNWNQNFTVAKHRRNQFMKDFESKIERLIESSVILYSVSEKRAWMVSMLSVLLHLSRCRVQVQRALGFDIPACKVSANGGKAAFETIMSCYQEPLKKVDRNASPNPSRKAVTIEYYINEVWAALDSARRESYKARELFNTYIIGYEMADFGQISESLRMKKHRIGSIRSGWTPLLGEVGLALFYEGIHDPIVSNHRKNSECADTLWYTIPRGFNLLTASIPCLLRTAQRHNSGDYARLTAKHQWRCSQPDVLFGVCRRTNKHVCSRLQQVVSHSTTKSPPPRLIVDHQTGAVVFQFKQDMYDIQEFLDNSPKERLRIQRGAGHSTSRSSSPDFPFRNPFPGGPPAADRRGRTSARNLPDTLQVPSPGQPRHQRRSSGGGGGGSDQSGSDSRSPTSGTSSPFFTSQDELASDQSYHDRGRHHRQGRQRQRRRHHHHHHHHHEDRLGSDASSAARVSGSGGEHRTRRRRNSMSSNSSSVDHVQALQQRRSGASLYDSMVDALQKLLVD